MALLENYSKHVARLSARMGVFKDHLDSSRDENRDQLKARNTKLKESLSDGVDEIGEDMTKSRNWMSNHMHGLHDAVSDDVDSIRAGSNKRKSGRDADKAERDAEVAAAYATAANVMAQTAINESERASIQALTARAEADELANA